MCSFLHFFFLCCVFLGVCVCVCSGQQTFWGSFHADGPASVDDKNLADNAVLIQSEEEPGGDGRGRGGKVRGQVELGW